MADNSNSEYGNQPISYRSCFAGRRFIAAIEWLAAAGSVSVSMLWLAYALWNHSGHTAEDPLLIATIQVIPLVFALPRLLVFGDPFKGVSFRVLVVAAAFGPAIPLILDFTGVLKEYNRWCKTGLYVPPFWEMLSVVLLLGCGLLFGLKKAFCPHRGKGSFLDRLIARNRRGQDQ